MVTVTFSHFSDVSCAGISFVMSSTTTRVRGSAIDLGIFQLRGCRVIEEVVVWF